MIPPPIGIDLLAGCRLHGCRLDRCGLSRGAVMLRAVCTEVFRERFILRRNRVRDLIPRPVTLSTKRRVIVEDFRCRRCPRNFANVTV